MFNAHCLLNWYHIFVISSKAAVEASKGDSSLLEGMLGVVSIDLSSC